MGKEKLFPDYIFESSWEVCNKVGGIYTVLSTRAKTLKEKLQDQLIFIGPDCWRDKVNPYFSSDNALYADWQKQAAEEGLTSPLVPPNSSTTTPNDFFCCRKICISFCACMVSGTKGILRT